MISHSWERVQCCLNCPRWLKSARDDMLGVCNITERLTFRSDVCGKYCGDTGLLTNLWGRKLNVEDDPADC